MTQRIYVDRSRVESYQRCPRRRWLEYHQDGTGVAPAKKNIYLAVGGSVHRGLEHLLRAMMTWEINREALGPITLSKIEQAAINVALSDFANYSGALELDSTEVAAMNVTLDAAQLKADMIAQAQELGMSTEGLGIDREQAMSQFDRMLYEEQSALVEGLVRAYARHKLRPLLEQFEVLEVEREGEWKLGEWEVPLHVRHEKDHIENAWLVPTEEYELWFMSRLDALLRERSTNQLYLQSFKTTGTWGDIRRLKAAEKDIQGLTEGIEVEQRLMRWWECARRHAQYVEADGNNMPLRMFEWLGSLQDPPRIYAVRYEYLLKGERWEDKELSAKLGMTVRTQRSLLIRQYVARSTPQKGQSGYSVGDVCWSWEFVRTEDDKDSKLAWQNWHSEPVPNVKEWIDKLSESHIVMSRDDSTVGMEPRQLGWTSEAQSLGVTRNHPFDDVFPPPVIVFRNDDELRDVVEQFEAQERSVAWKVEELAKRTDPGERRSFLNMNFPQHRHSCFYPTECWATRICYATNASVQADPLGAGEGKFVRRVPNHPQETKS